MDFSHAMIILTLQFTITIISYCIHSYSNGNKKSNLKLTFNLGFLFTYIFFLGKFVSLSSRLNLNESSYCILHLHLAFLSNSSHQEHLGESSRLIFLKLYDNQQHYEVFINYVYNNPVRYVKLSFLLRFYRLDATSWPKSLIDFSYI